jgi:hypothetical protein
MYFLKFPNTGALDPKAITHLNMVSLYCSMLLLTGSYQRKKLKGIKVLNHRKISRQNKLIGNNPDCRFRRLTNSTWKPLLRATSIMLFLVIPGKIVPFIAGVEITLPWCK